MSNKQTALNFLLTELDIPKLISREKLIMVGEIVRQAKAMHKQEIIDAYREGRTDQQAKKPSRFYNRTSEQYYNETFGK